MRRRILFVCCAALATMLVGLAGGAGATLTEFSLTFTGKHVDDASFPARLRHEGRFTASAPFCAAGSAVDTRDVQDGPLWVERTHTCDDGSGSIIVSMPNVTGEHGGNGSGKSSGAPANTKA